MSAKKSDPWDDAMCEPTEETLRNGAAVRAAWAAEQTAAKIRAEREARYAAEEAAREARKVDTAVAPKASAGTQLGAQALSSLARMYEKQAYNAMADGGVNDDAAAAQAALLRDEAWKAKQAAKSAKMDKFNGIRR